MRFLARFLGLLLAAGAFVAVVIDGAKSIADSTLRAASVGDVWAYVGRNSLAAAQGAAETVFSPGLWSGIVAPLLSTPFFVVLILLAALFLWLGRRPRSRIGYVVRG